MVRFSVYIPSGFLFPHHHYTLYQITNSRECSFSQKKKLDYSFYSELINKSLFCRNISGTIKKIMI